MAVGTAATKSIIQKVIARRFKKHIVVNLLSFFRRVFKDLSSQYGRQSLNTSFCVAVAQASIQCATASWDLY
jgi:hypothetical protein